jgi:hypothetical protein
MILYQNEMSTLYNHLPSLKLARSVVLSFFRSSEKLADIQPIIKALNEFFKDTNGVDWKKFINDEEREVIDESKATGIDYEYAGLDYLFEKIFAYSQIRSSIDYVRVIVDHHSHITYAERKALANTNSLGKLNHDWISLGDGKFRRDKYMILSIDSWGSHGIVFKIEDTNASSRELVGEDHLVNPILA